jgi:hypothetical protein
MEISFISSLDAQDEERIASVLLATVSALLDETSVPYTVRIKTSGQRLFQRSHPGIAAAAETAVLPPPSAHRSRPPVAK